MYSSAFEMVRCMQHSHTCGLLDEGTQGAPKHVGADFVLLFCVSLISVHVRLVC